MEVMDLWFLLIGGVLLFMAVSASLLRRLPLTASLLYLILGVCLGPHCAGLLRVDPQAHAPLLERFAEIAVLISLFSAGLKLRTPLVHGRFWLPVLLATLSMVLTVALCTLVGVVELRLPFAAALLLAAILAPTDPVLASDVQVEHPHDRDRLRFGLTGEAGLNDGTAFPLVLLGLGLLGLHDLGGPPLPGWRWLVYDLLWSVTAGLGSGLLLGTAVGHLVLVLRRRRHETLSLDDFLALGLIALAYGTAQVLRAYGFLAVFAAGLALRDIERRATEPAHPAHTSGPPSTEAQQAPHARHQGHTSGRLPPEVQQAQPPGHQIAPGHKDRMPVYMTRAVLGFTEHFERIAEVALVIGVGAQLHPRQLNTQAVWLVALLLLAIRPLSVWLGLRALSGVALSPTQVALMGWFGIRGIGSLYYLEFAIGHGKADRLEQIAPGLAQTLCDLTLACVAASIVVHGISVTPLMTAYGRATGALLARRRQRPQGPAKA